mmetsp:Transcript_12179/g.18400  ORF Transcript_12179/g.18400 Transcript_12179/m.18400 type:complete len:337 (+) Transcript_12179:65-1075(+)
MHPLLDTAAYSRPNLPSISLPSLLLFLYSIHLHITPVELHECRLLLGRNEVIDGVGVIAGRDYRAGEIIESPRAVMVHMNYTSQTMIEYYAASHVPDMDDVIFGYALMYNHNATYDVKFINPRFITSKRKGATPQLVFDVKAVRNIKRGSEIFASYGTELWFLQRHVPLVNTPSNSNHAIGTIFPGCLRTSIRIYRDRVYTTRHIRLGEVVEVARALILPVSRTLGNRLSQYVWYRETLDNVRGALLLLGNGAMYQAPRGLISDANLIYSWYDETGLGEVTLDKCALSMFIAFTATRDIVPYEELTVPLHVDMNFDGNTTHAYKRVLDGVLTPHCF